MTTLSDGLGNGVNGTKLFGDEMIYDTLNYFVITKLEFNMDTQITGNVCENGYNIIIERVLSGEYALSKLCEKHIMLCNSFNPHTKECKRLCTWTYKLLPINIVKDGLNQVNRKTNIILNWKNL